MVLRIVTKIRTIMKDFTERKKIKEHQGMWYNPMMADLLLVLKNGSFPQTHKEQKMNIPGKFMSLTSIS